MKVYRHRLLSTTCMTLAIGSGAPVLGTALPGADVALGAGTAYAACQPRNSCAANPCDPCAVEVRNALHPRTSGKPVQSLPADAVTASET